MHVHVESLSYEVVSKYFRRSQIVSSNHRPPVPAIHWTIVVEETVSRARRDRSRKNLHVKGSTTLSTFCYRLIQKGISTVVKIKKAVFPISNCSWLSLPSLL